MRKEIKEVMVEKEKKHNKKRTNNIKEVSYDKDKKKAKDTTVSVQKST